MYIDKIPNRGSPPAILIRESYRKNGKVCKRTLGNISFLPPEAIEALKRSFYGHAPAAPSAPDHLPDDRFDLGRGLAHGSVCAVLGSIRRLGLERMLDRKPSRERDIVMAMIADRLLSGDSKLATTRQCHSETATSTLGEQLNLSDLDADECYSAMDWLLERQSRMQKELARRHIQNGRLTLVDVSSSYFEGRLCPLAKHGYSRDHRRDLPQIVYGLICDERGRPVAVSVFDGNTSDHEIFPELVEMIRKDFRIEEPVFVGDRGMISGKAIAALREATGAHWITALNSVAIRHLMDGSSAQELFKDGADLREISNPDYPDERLVVCRNSRLAEERARKREELLVWTERQLGKIRQRISGKKNPLRGRDLIGIAVGKIISSRKMQKHFLLEIGDESLTWKRDDEKIRREAALDGLYVIRTDLKPERLASEDAVLHYKRLAEVERAFRSLKSEDLNIRPVRHRLEGRVRAHVFLCMLAYYVEFHMRERLKPFLFHDEDGATRTSPVAEPVRSDAAKLKDLEKLNAQGEAVSNFEDLIRQLATVVRAKVTWTADDGTSSFLKSSTPSERQQKMFDLLEVGL